MKYIIQVEVAGIKYWVKLYNTTGELRGLKGSATQFDSIESANFWKEKVARQSNMNRRNLFTIKPVE